MTTLEMNLELLKNYKGKPIKIMEVCGTHTTAIFKAGIKELISPRIQLISGPGCPVCVTPTSYIDRLVELCLKENTCVLSFGDMLKVNGTSLSLSSAKAKGGQVRLIYSPLQALELAEKSPSTLFVVAAVGFETTIPSYALLIESIIEKNIKNIKILTSLKTVAPAVCFICEHENDIDGFLCPGHVSVIIGSKAYESLAEKYKKPFVVVGFEAQPILAAILDIIYQLEDKKSEMINFYKSTVSDDGNIKAQEIIAKYFVEYDALWRGIGKISGSGLTLRDEFAFLEASETKDEYDKEIKNCSCSEVILGKRSPQDCPLFGKTCTPTSPVGACMVSTEGACGIYYRFGKGVNHDY